MKELATTVTAAALDLQSEWVPQGFFGLKDAVISAKLIVDQDMRAGVWVPLQGQPPMPVDIEEKFAMFAVFTRRGNSIPTPPGLMQADPALVGRLVNA